MVYVAAILVCLAIVIPWGMLVEERAPHSKKAVETHRQHCLASYYLFSRQREKLLSGLTIPPGKYAVLYCDMDLGSIIGDRPDPAPEVFDTFVDAVRRVREDHDDEMQYRIVDSNGDLICEGTGTIRLCDLDAICGALPRDREQLDRHLREA